MSDTEELIQLNGGPMDGRMVILRKPVPYLDFPTTAHGLAPIKFHRYLRVYVGNRAWIYVGIRP